MGASEDTPWHRSGTSSWVGDRVLASQLGDGSGGLLSGSAIVLQNWFWSWEIYVYGFQVSVSAAMMPSSRTQASSHCPPVECTAPCRWWWWSSCGFAVGPGCCLTG